MSRALVTGGKRTTNSEMSSTRETKDAICEEQEKLKDTEEKICNVCYRGRLKRNKMQRELQRDFPHEMHQDDSKRRPSNKETINFDVDLLPVSI